MLPLLYNSKEFQNVPIKERQRAAWEARQQAMRHWQFWLAIGLMIAATVAGSLVAAKLLGNDPGSTIGAALGFLLGVSWYGHILRRLGMPYYREILSKYEEKTG